MKLHSPIQITPRLLAGVKVGDAWLSIDWSKRPGRDGRARYHYHIDTPNWEHSDEDLQTGVGGGTLQAGLSSLLSFLGACAESRDYRDRTGRGENADLFPEHVGEWAQQNSDELTMLGMELDETPNLIEGE